MPEPISSRAGDHHHAGCGFATTRPRARVGEFWRALARDSNGDRSMTTIAARHDQPSPARRFRRGGERHAANFFLLAGGFRDVTRIAAGSPLSVGDWHV